MLKIKLRNVNTVKICYAYEFMKCYEIYFLNVIYDFSHNIQKKVEHFQ